MALSQPTRRSSHSLEALATILHGAEAPSFPRAVMQILRIIRDPASTLDEIAEAVQWDPGLMVRVLGAVNSAAYGPAQPIDNVAHAASYMGRGPLEQIVLAVAVRDALPAEEVRGYEPARFWRTAAFRATLARALANRLHPASQAECFTVGLLQDMAVPVLAVARSEDYGPLLEEWHGPDAGSLSKLEQDAFGWSHAEIGALLGHAWELPRQLVQSIQRHHREDCDDHQLLPAIRLVSILRETRGEHGIDALVEEARRDFGLEPDWTQGAVQAAEERAYELALLLAG